MKVKILIPIVGAIDGVTFSYKTGDAPDVSKETAMDWIRAGHAEALEKPAKPADAPEKPAEDSGKTKKNAKTGE